MPVNKPPWSGGPGPLWVGPQIHTQAGPPTPTPGLPPKKYLMPCAGRCFSSRPVSCVPVAGFPFPVSFPRVPPTATRAAVSEQHWGGGSDMTGGEE